MPRIGRSGGEETVLASGTRPASSTASPTDGLKVTWRVPLGSGYSGPAVADGRVFVLDWTEDPDSRTLDGSERVVALDETTGAILWTHRWDTSYQVLQARYAVGPRATPTVDGDRVFVVGATGRLLCLETASGRVVWERDYVADYDTSVPAWGITSAPLVEGDLLIALVGGEPDALVVAFDKHTGRGAMASPAGRGRTGVRPTGGLRGRRRPSVDHLAPRRACVARPGDGRGALAATVGSRDEHVHRHPGQGRRLLARQSVLQRVADDEAEARTARRRPSSGEDRAAASSPTKPTDSTPSSPPR